MKSTPLDSTTFGSEWYNSKSGDELMGNVLKYGLCSAIVCLSLLGCSAHTDGPGKIDVNSAQSGSASPQPSETPSPVSTDNEVEE